MRTQRIATVTPIDEQDARGKVAAIYEDIKKTNIGLDGLTHGSGSDRCADDSP
jgi:hypothetical protein